MQLLLGGSVDILPQQDVAIVAIFTNCHLMALAPVHFKNDLDIVSLALCSGRALMPFLRILARRYQFVVKLRLRGLGR